MGSEGGVIGPLDRLVVKVKASLEIAQMSTKCPILRKMGEKWATDGRELGENWIIMRYKCFPGIFRRRWLGVPGIAKKSTKNYLGNIYI